METESYYFLIKTLYLCFVNNLELINFLEWYHFDNLTFKYAETINYAFSKKKTLKS